MNRDAEETARLAAYGSQLLLIHARLRDQLDDLRDGGLPDVDFEMHCVAFCSAVTGHHTGEDETAFPLLAARHPELREFLGELRRDHEVIAAMLSGLADAANRRERLDGLAAVLETHFRGEEKRLADVLNAVTEPLRLE
jgi:hypothetical protein